MGTPSASPAPAQGLVLWLTGHSGAGKSTISALAADELRARGHRVQIIDGDLIRERLSPDLGFSRADRDENVRRVTVLADLLSQHGVIVLAAMISPYRERRDQARAELGGRFVEIHVRASLEACAQRDPKGLYAKALSGQIGEFTGISDPYEPPLEPELVLETEQLGQDECAARILAYVDSRLATPSLATGD
jgi:adenylyl-sulfate kinase